MTAGTIMHRSHLPLKTWLMAVHIVTSHSNGISALQLQAQLGLGSYKSAWLLLHKLRRAMVDPDRSLLEDLVEIDEATLPFRTVKDPTTGGQGRSRQGKMRIAGAVELSPEGEPRRIRLAPIGDFSARSLHAFVAGTSAPGARVITDGWSGLACPTTTTSPRSSVQRPPTSCDLDPSLEPEALGARNLPCRCAAPICAAISTSSWLEPPPPHRNGLRHPARHRRAPPTRRLSRHRRTTRLILAGRAPATARPPIRIGAEYRSSSLPDQQSKPTSPSPKALAHRPARSENRAWNVEGRSTSGVTGSKGRSPPRNSDALAARRAGLLRHGRRDSGGRRAPRPAEDRRLRRSFVSPAFRRPNRVSCRCGAICGRRRGLDPATPRLCRCRGTHRHRAESSC